MNTQHFIYLLTLCLVLLFSCRQAAQKSVVAKEKITQPEQDIPEKSVVFIAGYDEGDNPYYQNARSYFQQQEIAIVDSLYSLSGILNWLNHQEQAYSEIHVVSHSNPWRGMSLTITPEGDRVTDQSLMKALGDKLLPTLSNMITEETQLIFHSCGLGNNASLLELLKKAFSGTCSPTVYASPMYNVFGGKYSPHHLAKVYYAYYPTAYTPGKHHLSKELAAAYPEVDIDWLKALNTHDSTHPGGVYSYRYNIPVEWELEFENEAEIPDFQSPEEIMDWIVEVEEIAMVLYNFQIPMEKYRWRSEKKGNTLLIKGKTTAVCVIQPAMHPEEPMEYAPPDVSNTALYTKL